LWRLWTSVNFGIQDYPVKSPPEGADDERIIDAAGSDDGWDFIKRPGQHFD